MYIEDKVVYKGKTGECKYILLPSQRLDKYNKHYEKWKIDNIEYYWNIFNAVDLFQICV